MNITTSVHSGMALASSASSSSSSSNGLKRKGIRRSSEGAFGIGSSGSAPDIKCETCGKGYKHTSCLNKHLWEHTPEWIVTSRLSISKHQQVQLLEAASILVNMNSPPKDTLHHTLASPFHLGLPEDHRVNSSREGSHSDALDDDIDMDEDDGVFGEMENE